MTTDTIHKALSHINRTVADGEHHGPISFEEYLRLVVTQPTLYIRNVFQIFHDMVHAYIPQSLDEYPADPESIHYLPYDCTRLFVENSDHPFFADRLFANRLVNLVEDLQRGAQQNKIYVFEGPPGSGKSTFLNNLLQKFEEYANSPAGTRYQTVWRITRPHHGGLSRPEAGQFLDRLSRLIDEYEFTQDEVVHHAKAHTPIVGDDFIEIPCPSHDNPLLMIPKNFRRQFFDDLFKNDEFKWRLFTEKEYEWLFRQPPCTICSSLFEALLERYHKPTEVFRLLFARPLHVNRRIGEGISIFNPGDEPLRHSVLSNEMLQERLNVVLRDSNSVQYFFSHYAKTNNGIYALMDIKGHNVNRFTELHNIVSEGVHKVEDLEENVDSLFMALINPEDLKNIDQFQSFSDRIQTIKMPYILDLNTEVMIYRTIFGKHIDHSFLPRVLHNFARIVISTRMNNRSEAMIEWIGDSTKYQQFCDDSLMLLKMEIYTGHIPSWLSEEDRKRLTAKRRRTIIAESENEGHKGCSGRDAIKIFNDFYSTYVRKDSIITMSVLVNYFTKSRLDLCTNIPDGFIESLVGLYNFSILQEVKESLFNYNEEQISRDIQHYLFAINFEPGRAETCSFTGERINITESFFEGIEFWLLGRGTGTERRLEFRHDTQKEYTANALTKEMLTEGKTIVQTKLYNVLYERYLFTLKEKALDPFLDNDNFRRAIKDFGKEEFKTYDLKIRDDVTFLINNLCTNYHYTKQGAKEVCIYVIDNNLAREFRSW
jgi:predicted Ser/Thr protein kinase